MVNRVFVTGGTGFIGSHLIDALVRRGDKVTCYVRSGDNNREGIDRLLLNNVRIATTINDLKKYDIVYHVAGVLGKKGIPLSVYREAHIELPRFLISMMNGTQKLVYMSSNWVEDPEKPYELTKVDGEKAVMSYANNYTIIRPGFVYGARDYHHLPLFRSVQKYNKFFPIYGDGNNVIAPTYIDDVIKYTIEPTMSPMSIAGEHITMANFLKTIARVLGVDEPRIHIPSVIAKRLPKSDFFMKERAFKTAPTTTPLEEGLTKTIEWYRERRLL